MQIEIITIFPDIFTSYLQTSLLAKAIERGTLSITCTNLRDFAEPPHFKVDDEIYGGGAGMLMKPEPLAKAIKAAKTKLPDARVIYLSPGGTPFAQKIARDLQSAPALILLCGRYEGIDQRIIDQYVDLELSIGDYILMGGEVAAMVVIEAVSRLLTDVVGNAGSLQQESFELEHAGSLLLEGPQYTRPPEFEGQTVPAILLSGDHAKISAWQKEQALIKTKKIRPDLIERQKS